jgi:thimet oligopeptidase
LLLKKEERTFENTVRAYDLLLRNFHIVTVAIENFDRMSPDDAIRKACHKAAKQLADVRVELFDDQRLYHAFNDYITSDTYKKEKLDEEERYFVQEAMKDFKRSGFHFEKEQFDRIKEIKKKREKLRLEFESNINTDKKSITVTEDELKGVDSSLIKTLEKDGDCYILPYNAPNYIEVMKNCDVESTRKAFYFVRANRAYPKNIDVLNKLIAVNDELAKALGFESFASLDLDDQMVKTPKRARDFLEELIEKGIKKAEQEFKEVTKELPPNVCLDEKGRLSIWDTAYVRDKYKKRKFNIDENKIAEYFPVQRTLERIFAIYQEFLGLEFKFLDVNGLWHEDVKTVQIYEKESGKLRGTLFLDLYPRDNKYPSAYMDDIVPTTRQGDTIVPAVILIVANFPKATKEKPALLKHHDVETFFHEFGHAMHGFLGATRMNSFSGTSTKRDFVEMPSQMFEEWMWDKDIIKFVSSHYETGVALPDDMIDKKIALKKTGYGSFVVGQSFYSLFALDCFGPGNTRDTDELAKILHNKCLKHVRFEPESHFQAAFSHLENYGAKYYGYLWSKIFAIDLFYKIKEHGLRDYRIGTLFAQNVLGKGGSVDPDVLLKDFLGRTPNQDAFLKELGV